MCSLAVVYQDRKDKLRHTGLFFPPDPGARATIGGMIANNAERHPHGALRLHPGLRHAPGVALAERGADRVGYPGDQELLGLHLSSFVGSEGTLGIVVEAVDAAR